MSTDHRPVVVGVCGLIGSGKSMVSRLLRLRGIPVYDCDAEAKRIMDSDEEVHTALQHLAGPDVVHIKEGRHTINRNLLAERMFSDVNVLTGVNSLIHKLVKVDFRQWVIARSGEHVVGVESAIMATSGMAPLCDVLWSVEADEQIREQRVMERNATTVERVRQWMKAQRPEQQALTKLVSEGKIHVVHIDNNGHASLLHQIQAALMIL